MSAVSRATYYARRMREAGVNATAQKMRSFLAPYVRSPAYLIPLPSTAVPDGSLDRLDAFGGQVRARLEEQAETDPAYRTRAEARARKALSGSWTVLGYGEAPIPNGAGWASDSFHDHQWPHRYFPLVDFVAAGHRCDVKIAWELSRLQYLVWLAEGAVLFPAMRTELLADFNRIAEDWIAANAPGMGVNWTCAMEVAIRGLNLMMASAIVGQDLRPDMRSLIVRSLVDHYHFLRRFPETSDIAGNHYLTDLLGELGLSIVVEASPDAFHAHFQAFCSEAERQFEPDGCHIERAPVYHRLCTEIVAIGAAFAARRSGEPPSALQPILDRAIRFAVTIADTSGRLPVIGDCDSGQIFDFGSSARDIAGLVALTDETGERPLPDFAIWLQAISGSADKVRASAVPVEAVASRSGFLAGKTGSASVVMRVGAQGLGGRASHDHDDAQTVWLSSRGRDLIVDRGCHSYTLDPAIRHRDISSRSHNVVQPIAAPRFRGREGSINLTARGAPHCSFAAADRRDETIRFTAALGPAGALNKVTRLLELQEHQGSAHLHVSDTWSAREPVELRWHFGPGLRPEIAGPIRIVFAGDDILRRLELQGDDLGPIEVFEFDFSPVYGQMLPCFGVRVALAPAGTILSKFYLAASPPTDDQVQL